MHVNHPVNIVILAAGRGTRMKSDLPKVLHPLSGKPMLAHVIDSAATLEPDAVCVVYGHGGETVPQAISREGLAWALQSEQLGTAHAVQQALPHIQPEGVTLVLYGDVPLISPATLQRVLAAAGEGRVALMTALLPDATGYGRIVRNEAGQIERIVEHKDASAAERAIREINTGILAAPTAALRRWLAQVNNDNAQGEYYLPDIIGMAVAEGMPVEAVMPDSLAEIMGVNSKSQLAELERIYQRQRAEELMVQGVTLMDPARIDIRGELLCAADVVIDVNCVFEGRVVLGRGVKIAPNCVLRDVEIAEGVEVLPYTLVEETKVGADARLGPFARIRPGTVLGRDVHIGDFVELKNAVVGDNSKINHMSYVGDSEVGRNVNIGAGTITCNYDGANKHRTVIEDDVFIGSDSQLVAPVTVEKGATVAAGSTITRTVPAGSLTLSRVKQTSISGWQRPKKK
jgi:bifunctional UDP-N-acetylglucosamine pyrophosphorylase / glucosamine-1-phosphate N-acetyltransferase